MALHTFGATSWWKAKSAPKLLILVTFCLEIQKHHIHFAEPCSYGATLESIMINICFIPIYCKTDPNGTKSNSLPEDYYLCVATLLPSKSYVQCNLPCYVHVANINLYIITPGYGRPCQQER